MSTNSSTDPSALPTTASPAPRRSPRDLSVLVPFVEPTTRPPCQAVPPHVAEPLEADPLLPSDALPMRLTTDRLASLRLVHGHTEESAEAPAQPAIVGALRSGRTTWVSADLTQPRVWLSWQWVHIEPSVVMLVNPLEVHSNAQLTDTGGRLLCAVESVIHFNRLIHGLDWHRVIRLASARID